MLDVRAKLSSTIRAAVCFLVHSSMQWGGVTYFNSSFIQEDSYRTGPLFFPATFCRKELGILWIPNPHVVMALPSIIYETHTLLR